jgi:hypothetical protein
MRFVPHIRCRNGNKPDVSPHQIYFSDSLLGGVYGLPVVEPVEQISLWGEVWVINKVFSLGEIHQDSAKR